MSTVNRLEILFIALILIAAGVVGVMAGYAKRDQEALNVSTPPYVQVRHERGRATIECLCPEKERE